MTDHTPCPETSCKICFPPNKFVFPQDEPNGLLSDKFQRQGGMTMRDYFAAQAVASLIMAAQFNPADKFDAVTKTVTNLAYKLADEMLEARKENAK